MINFFYGEDTFTLAEKLREIRKQGEICEIQGLSDDKELLADIRMAFENQGLFAARKIIILKNIVGIVNKFPRVEEYLEQILEEPPQDEIYFVQTENFDKRLKFYKKLQKLAAGREFLIPAGKDFEAWIVGRCREKAVKISQNALKKFVDLLGETYTLWQADQEISKLALYRLDSAEIESKDIEKVVSRNAGEDLFQIINLVAEQKNIGAAISLLEQQLAGSQSAELKAEIIQMIGALASQFRSLLLVKDIEKLSPAEIASKLKWKPGRVWVMQKLSKKFTASRLRQFLSDLKALDMRLKTSEEPPKLLLTLFFQKVADTLV